MQDVPPIGIQRRLRRARRENKYIGYAGIATQYFASMIVVDNKQPDGIDPGFPRLGPAHRRRLCLDHHPPARQETKPYLD